VTKKGFRIPASGVGKEEPQAASHKAKKSPFIPLFQRGKEGDLNIGTRYRPLRGRD